MYFLFPNEEKLPKWEKYSQSNLICASRCNSEIFSLVRESSILNADVKVAVFIPFLCFLAVVAGWAESQQPGQQSGCTALSGKQKGVREEGDGHRGAELGGCLSASNSLLLPLHRPALIILPLHRSFIFTSSRQRKRKKKEQLYQKNSSATLKKIGRMKQPNHSGHKHACQYI